jgi:hypothetical protein
VNTSKILSLEYFQYYVSGRVLLHGERIIDDKTPAPARLPVKDTATPSANVGSTKPAFRSGPVAALIHDQ